MAGMFELFNDEEGLQIQNHSSRRTVMAVSRAFSDKPSAVAGIKEVAGVRRHGSYSGSGPQVTVHTDVQLTLQAVRYLGRRLCPRLSGPR